MQSGMLVATADVLSRRVWIIQRCTALPEPVPQGSQTLSKPPGQQGPASALGKNATKSVERGVVLLPRADANPPPRAGPEDMPRGFQHRRAQILCRRGGQALIVPRNVPVGLDQAIPGRQDEHAGGLHRTLPEVF